MLKTFRTNIPVQIAIILVVAALMWMKSFVHPLSAATECGGELYFWITGSMKPAVATIVAFILVLAEGVLFNSILYRHKMITQSSLLPMLFYVIAMSVGHPTLSPVIMGSLFLLIGIDQLLLTSTLLSVGLDKVFGASACIALSTLFCPVMVVFVIPLVASMFNYSLYSWRDNTMLVLGFLSPFIILETYYFVCDELFYRNYLLLYNITDFHLHVGGNFMQWAVSIVFLVMIVIGMGTAIGGSQNRSINFNKNITTLLLFTLGSIALSIYTSIIPVATQCYAIPFACCSTFLFIEPGRKELVPNAIFVLAVLLFVVFNLI